MRLSLVCTALASALSIATAAAAQPAAEAAAPPQVKIGQWIYSSDGAAIGRIDRVERADGGAAKAVAVIYKMRMVYIPVDSLSAGQKGFVTSLTKSDVVNQK